jgi:hypothetical protein
VETSLNLITVGTNYEEAGDQTAALRSSRNKLMDLLEGNTSPSDLYAANKELDNAFQALYHKLTGLALTSEDAGYIDDDFARMNNAASVIEKSEYNKAVRAFHRNTLSVFPTNLLRNLCFTSDPELFE